MMKSRTWKWTTLLYQLSVLTLVGTLLLTIIPANAQLSSMRGGNSPEWTAGHRMPHTSQPLRTQNTNANTLHHDVRYKVVPIGVLTGKTNTYLPARAVNNFEHVTGFSFIWYGGDFQSQAVTTRSFIWQNGKLKALPLLSGWPGAAAFGINARDQVAGTAYEIDSNGNFIATAVLWDHGQPTNLGALEPDGNSDARDINIWGVIVGASYDATEELPVAWYGGKTHQLPLLPGQFGGFAFEINDLGMIVGTQWSDTDSIPCLWYWNGTSYTALSLGSFGGQYGQGLGINNLGQAVGWSNYAGDEHGPAFLWNYLHGLQALALLPGGLDAFADNINDLGQIVGFSGTSDGFAPAIWQNGKVTDLQQLVPADTPPLTWSMGNINDLGEIAVNATNPDGSPLALLLVPAGKR
jgi:probable HAF family extracellular repeat protein